MLNTQYHPRRYAIARSRGAWRRMVTCAALSCASVGLFAAAPYVQTQNPIRDAQGRNQIIIDFTADAHLSYPVKLTALPRTSRDAVNTPIDFFHNPKPEALVSEVEATYGNDKLGRQ